jgi:hypothetical protein
MKPRTSNGKGKAGKRGTKDLPVSDAKARNPRGGSIGSVIKSIGDGLSTLARKQ